MNLKNTYGMKDISDLTLITKDRKYELDYANEVHVQEYLNSNNRKNVLILAFCQLRDDNMPTTNINNIIVSNNCKKSEDDSIFNRNEKHSGNFNLVYSSYISTCETISEFVYAFCDGDVKSGYIKKEINEILNRRKQDDLIDTISNVSHSIDNKDYILKPKKDLYFDLYKADNGLSCNIYLDGIIACIHDSNINGIVNRIISIINNYDYDIKIYGDVRGFGLALADGLKSKGYLVQPTTICRD